MTRFLRFHRLPDGTWRHPTELTGPEIGRFLTHLAVDGKVSASTQTQALSAIVFMYRQVLEIEPGNIDGMRAQKPQRLPTVLSISEVRLILDQCRQGQPHHRPVGHLLPRIGGEGTGDAAAPYSRELGAEVDSGDRVEGRSDKENQLPHVSSQLRDSSAGKRIGYPHSSGTARAFGCEYLDDLHSRFTTGTVGRPKPAGSVVS